MLHKIFGTKPNDGIQPKECLAYSFAGFGQNLICSLVSSFIMIYYTDAVGLKAASVAWLVLATRVYDAIYDPIMGSIVDKTRTRWGKLRPYVLFAPIPIVIITVLCFTTISNAPLNTKFIYAALTYVIWSVAYTIMDVPYWGLSSAMTSNTDIRSKILTVARIFCTAGAGLISIAIPTIQGSVERKVTGGLAVSELTAEQLESLKPLISESLRTMYFWLAVVISIIAIPTFILGFKHTKERCYDNSESQKISHNLSLLFKNKPLLLIVLSGILGSLRGIVLVSGIYFAKYNLENTAYYTLVSILIIPGGLMASILCPYLANKFGKKKVLIYSHIIGGGVVLASYLIGYQSKLGMAFAIVALALWGIPLGLNNIMCYAMIADSIDYLEYKTGERGEGICFAMQTFINKIGMAACAFGILIILAINNFDEYVNSVASENVKKGIWFASTCLTAISSFLSIIPLLFYKFNEKEQARVAEINLNRRLDKQSENNL